VLPIFMDMDGGTAKRADYLRKLVTAFRDNVWESSARDPTRRNWSVEKWRFLQTDRCWVAPN